MFRTRILLVLLLISPALMWGQGATTTDLVEHLEAMSKATDDAAKGGLNERIKQELRSLLDRDDAFDISFDSVPLSRVDAPDGTFRLFTWNVAREDGSHLYEGMLLSRSGKQQTLKELRDMSSSIPSPEVPELGPDRWYGALYYDVIPVKRGAKTYYTLLGWKGHSKVETRKVIEVLHFKGNQPRFGAPLFGTGKLKAHRKVYGYSFQASMGLWFEKEQARIVLDHLSPVRADMKGQWAYYGPDLSYDAYAWDKGEWRYERDIDARDIRRSGKPFNAPPAPPRP